MHILYTFFIVLISFSTLAQGQLSLNVVDDNQDPIEYANFRLFTPVDSSVVTGEYTGVNGRIILNDLPNGDYYGIITFFGFEDKLIKDISISASQRKVNLGSVMMTKVKSQEFEEVVIKGETTLMESSIDKRTYNVSEDMTSIGGGL